MADPTITQVMLDAAQHLGDPTQQQFSNAVLMPYFSQSFREMYDLMEAWRLPTGNRTAYAYLPAYTNRINLTQAGIADIGRPTRLWERLPTVSSAISAVTNATPSVVTVASGTSFGNNVLADVMGVVGPVGINAEWYIETSGNSITLNGSVAGGAYSGGGTVVYSGDYWHQMTLSDPLPQWVPGQYLVTWKWADEIFEFIGAVNAVELKIEYASSGDPPTSGNVGVDNCLNYTGFRTAALAAADYQMVNQSAYLNKMACGPSLEPDGTGGALRRLLNPLLLQKQGKQSIPGTFRPRRNTEFVRGWW